MQSLTILLSLLSILSTMLNLLFLTIATHQTIWHHLLTISQSLSTALLPNPVSAPQPPTLPIWHPTIALQDFAYTTLLARLPHHALAPYLRASQFPWIAQALATGALDIQGHTIELDAAERRKVAYLASLPTVVCTPPEDGDRAAQRGQRGQKKVRVDRRFLVAPRVVARPGRALRKEEEAREAERRAAETFEARKEKARMLRGY